MKKSNPASEITPLVEKLKAQTNLSDEQERIRKFMIGTLLGETRRAMGATKNAFRKAKKLIDEADPVAALRSLRDNRRRTLNAEEFVTCVKNLAAKGLSHRQIQKKLGCQAQAIGNALASAGEETIHTTDRDDSLTESKPMLDIHALYVARDLQLVVLLGQSLSDFKISFDALLDHPNIDYPSEFNNGAMALTRFELALQNLCRDHMLYGAHLLPADAMPWLRDVARNVKGKKTLVLFQSVRMRTDADAKWISELFPDAHVCRVESLPEGLITVLHDTRLNALGAGYLPSLEPLLGIISEGPRDVTTAFSFEQTWQGRRAAFLSRINDQMKLRKDGISLGLAAHAWIMLGQKNLVAVNSAGNGYTYRYDDGSLNTGEFKKTVTAPWYIAQGCMLLEPGSCDESASAKSSGSMSTVRIWFEPSCEEPVAMGIWAPNLQLLLFRTISSREFARRVKNMAAKLPTPSEVVGVDDLAIFWRRHPNKVCDALRKLTAKPKHREWSVGIALAIFGVDFLFVALREQYPKQHFALVKEIADTAATFIEKHREKFVAYARKVAKMNVDPSECFLEAMVGFLRHLQELPREVLILARFGFVEQIKGAAKKGIALKSIEEAKQTIGSGKYVFGNFWPVAKLTLEVSVKTFGAYLGYVSRRLANLEFAYDPAKLDQVATETEIDALGNDADASAAEPDKP